MPPTALRPNALANGRNCLALTHHIQVVWPSHRTRELNGGDLKFVQQPVARFLGSTGGLRRCFDTTVSSERSQATAMAPLT
jgi:hypothetical protein